MSTLTRNSKIVIIGAGMGGSLMAVHLARLGFEIEIYERRADMRTDRVERGRSINMTLATRGLEVLSQVGLLDAVMDETIPLQGRLIHNLDGTRTFQPYGKNGSEAIHSIKRNKLNITLMEAAQALPNVKLFFHKRCVNIDKQNGVLQLQDERTREMETVHADLIIGADGAFSTVRQQMHRGVRAHYKQDFLDWGYKELTIPPAANKSHQIENHALHIWPRGDHMLLAMPNADGSFTCTCILPFEGDYSFSTLNTPEAIKGLFQKWFPDALPLMPNLVEEFNENPIVEMITTHTHPWYFRDRVVLLGDACHAVVPFYGLGMNAAFEDCAVLSDCIARATGGLEGAFAEYQRRRKPNTDVLAELSKENFVELREKIESPLFVARKKVDVVLNRMFPRVWIPLYTMMSHTNMPFTDAVKRARRQTRIARCLGMDVVLLSAAGATVAWGYGRKIKGRLRRRGRVRFRGAVTLPSVSGAGPQE